MVDDGLMQRFGIQEIYGMHNMPGMDTGEFAIRSGPFFAAADTIHIKVTGKGGHASRPQGAIDPTLTACQIVVTLQSIISRNIDPLAAAVISICSVTTDTNTSNVIPQTATLLGTLRTTDGGVREAMISRIEEVCEATAKAFGASAEFTLETGYPVMVNSPEQTGFAAEAAHRVAGKVNVEAEMVMGAEDFAFMINARPGAYILTGNGDSAPLHHPEYDFNDDAIPSGSSWYVEITEGRMPAT